MTRIVATPPEAFADFVAEQFQAIADVDLDGDATISDARFPGHVERTFADVDISPFSSSILELSFPAS